jgi:quercetin dioxygenase-like cupin family protein
MTPSIVRQAGEGEQFWFAGGGVFTMQATSEETGGAFTLIEDRVVRGKTTPLHSHPYLDETIYMLDGEMRVHVDGEENMIGKQGVIFAARGVPHAFMITSDTVHLLVLQTPGSGEDFYRAAGEPLTSADDTSRPADFPKLQRAAQEHRSARPATVRRCATPGKRSRLHELTAIEAAKRRARCSRRRPRHTAAAPAIPALRHSRRSRAPRDTCHPVRRRSHNRLWGSFTPEGARYRPSTPQHCLRWSVEGSPSQSFGCRTFPSPVPLGVSRCGL